MHDDKNISKKVDKNNSSPTKKTKTDQILNTDVSIPIKKDGLSNMSASKQKPINE
jgi:hypothetical protein